MVQARALPSLCRWICSSDKKLILLLEISQFRRQRSSKAGKMDWTGTGHLSQIWQYAWGPFRGNTGRDASHREWQTRVSASTVRAGWPREGKTAHLAKEFGLFCFSWSENNEALLKMSKEGLCHLVTCMKRQKDGTPKDKLARSVGAQYATGEEWRNKSRKKEDAEPKNNAQLWMCLVMGVKSDAVKNSVA